MSRQTRRSYRRPNARFPHADEIFDDSDPDTDFDHPSHLDADAQIRSTDHLFDVLVDMFPRRTPEDLRAIWEKHRPNIEEAICHVLAQSEQELPDVTREPYCEAMAIDDDNMIYGDWSDAGFCPGSQHEASAPNQGHLSRYTRDSFSNDFSSEASCDSFPLSCVSSSLGSGISGSNTQSMDDSGL
eukprot:c4409_g1_i1.p1 GENE.c4409_g1_i1~~c4409_g1_i1.p1  ORF type:complete len:185 (-),score=25.73 c4409_g1_i1:553-1107(-)